MRITKLVLAGVLLATTSAWAAPPPDLDATIAKAMATFDVPGAALAIVEDGKTVLTKGYGVRGLEDKRPVDEKTLFAIGSSSKAFTAALIENLVDEGKMSLDDRLIDRVPGFQLPDPYAASNATVLDVLTHRSGLVGGDVLWRTVPAEKLSRTELLRRARYLPVTLTFRAKFSYNNIGYVAAGEAAANAAGTSWETALRTRILKPLGIEGAALTGAELAKADNKAQQHAWLGDGIRRGKVSVMPTIALDAVGPAGSLAMSAEQLAKWVAVQLNDGALPDGKRLWSEARAREMRTIVSPMPIADPPAGSPDKRSNFSGYALGWMVSDMAGHVVVQHGGAVPGQRAMVMYVPDLKVGFAMTTSTDDMSVLQAITATLLDHYLKRPAADRVALIKSTTDAQVAKLEAAQKKIEETRAADAKLPADADKLIGTWNDNFFGPAVIARSGDLLTIKLGDATDMESKLEPWQRDTFLVRWKDRNMGKAYVTVLRRPNDGTPERIVFTGTSPLGGPSFYDGLDFKRAK